MARNTLMPSMGKGSGRVVATVVVVALIVMVIRDPVGAARGTRAVVVWVGNLLDRLGAFGSAVAK